MAVGLGISLVFQQLGTEFFNIYTNSYATYFFLIAGLFWGLFSILYFSLDRFGGHFKGKPAKVISFIVSFMGVTLLVYGKSTDQVITLLKGAVGLFWFTFLGSIIAVSGFRVSKDFKTKAAKYLMRSAGIFIATSFIVVKFNNFFDILNVTSTSSISTVAMISSLLELARGISLLVALSSLSVMSFGWTKNIGSTKNKSPERKNRVSMKKVLSDILKETKNAQKTIDQMTDNLKNLERMSKEGDSE